MSIPAVEVVRIFNTDDRGPNGGEDIYILSVSSDGPSFYTSFYRPQTIAPGKDFTLEVVFLPRAVGSVDSSITIQTSAGNYVLQVSGRGIPNPYKVQPFVGIKIPVGEAYEPSIEIYNPHYEVLSVREIYTSSSALNLLLPPETVNFTAEKCGAACLDAEDGSESGDNAERAMKLWDVAPHARRSLIKLRFLSQKTGKFQGSVNIKTSKDMLIVPVDVSVVSGAVHKTPEELDFGVLTLQDTKTLNLTLLNSGATLLQASDLQIAGSSDPNLDFQFQPTTLPPKRDVVIASLTYSARSEGTFKGKLLLRTNDTNPSFARIEIPYRVRVLAGYLSYSTAQTTFASFDSKITQSGEMIKIDKLEPVTQEILLTNKFSVPLVLFSAEIEDTQLRVVDFVPSQVVEPGESWPALKIEFRPRASFLLFTTHLHLTTNATLISIPLHICHGKLTFRLPDEAHRYSVGPLASKSSDESVDAAPHTGTVVNVHSHSFDAHSQHISFGTVPVNEVQTLTLNVTNHNPIKLPLLGLWTDVEGLNLKLESVWNAQGYRSVSSVAFQAHRPGIFDEKPSPPSPTRSSSSTSPSSGKSSDKKRNAPKKASSSNDSASNKHVQSEKEEVFELLPGHSALFSLELKSTRDTVAQGFIYFATPYERIAVNVSYTSFAGKLELVPERFKFEPNLRTSIPLHLEHTYSRSITITSITSNDARIQVELPKGPAGSGASLIGSQDERHLWIRPNTSAKFGSISFRPLAGSKPASELLMSTSSGSETIALPAPKDTITESEVRDLISSIDLTPQKRHNDIRATLTVTTDLRTVHVFPVRVQRWRPTIVALGESTSNSTMDFGLVEIETGVQEHGIEITNPLNSTPILVQLQLAASSRSASEKDGNNASLDKKSESCIGDYSFAKSALKFAILNPGETRVFGPVLYQPSREGICTSALFVRSNLTTIEEVPLHGFGGGGRLTFSKEVRVSAASVTDSTSSSVSSASSDTKTAKRSAKPSAKDFATEVRVIDQLRFAVKDSSLKACDEVQESSSGKKSASSDDKDTLQSNWTPPVLTKTVVVENKGDLPLFIQSVFLASPTASDSLVSSWRRSSSPSTKKLGGFTVVEDGTKRLNDNGKLVPGERLSVSVSFSPDFSTSESRYDLVLRSNSTREFRFSLVGVISDEKLAACASKFRVSGYSSTASVETPLIVAFIGLLGVVGFVWDRRRRQAVDRLENELPQTNSTPSTPTKSASSTESTPKNKDKDVTSVAAKSKANGVEDLENHSSPVHVAATAANHAAIAPVTSSGKDGRKKDKKEKAAAAAAAAAENKAHGDSSKSPKSSDSKSPNAKANTANGAAAGSTASAETSPIPVRSTTPPATLSGPQTPATSPVSTPGSVSDAKKPTTPKSVEKSDSSEKHALATESSPTSPTSASATPASHQTTKKKDKKDKKDLWQNKPTEPVFAPIEPARADTSPRSGKSTNGANHTEPASQDRKNKKSPSPPLPATAAAANTNEKHDSPNAANAGQPTSPKRSPSPPESDNTDVYENGASSPPSAVRQTLVPAKRPSSKPLPKYARKDGLGKDAPTAMAPIAITPAIAPNAAGPVVVSVPATKPAKESKKNRQLKEYKQKQSLSGVPVPTTAEPVATPVTRVHESAAEDAQAGHNTAGWRITPPAAPVPIVAVGPKVVPAFPGGTLSQLNEYPALGSSSLGNVSSLGSSSSHVGSSSPAAFTNPLLVSPGSMSASRYDYGRRALSGSGGFSPSVLNFDFSNAPSFDNNGVHSRPHSRENSTTPPLGPGGVASAITPPMMRWYNPMAPGNGSVENLLASFVDGTSMSAALAASGDAHSSSGMTPDNVSFFSSFGPGPLLDSSPSSPSSSSSTVDWSSTGPIAPGVSSSSAWNTPSTDSAVEENASTLSMLGLAPRSSVRSPTSGSSASGGSASSNTTSAANISRADGATSPFFLGLHNVAPDPNDLSSMGSPSVPPGLGVPDDASHLLGPEGAYTSMPPNSPFSHLSFFSGSNLDDPEFY